MKQILEWRALLAGNTIRRHLLQIGTGLVTGMAFAEEGASAQVSPRQALLNEGVVRRYFKSWEKKDWAPFDAILASDFTFTSPNDDDHISKTAFKARCWDSQIDFVDRFDLELLMAKGNDVLVKYLCHTKNGKQFRNVEYHRLADQKIEAIECYFGGKSSFASAIGSQPT